MYRQMMTNQDVRAYNLNEEEAWKSFVHSAGDIVQPKNITIDTREIARKCSDLQRKENLTIS